jgi:SAM-dependent methyltransferase
MNHEYNEKFYNSIERGARDSAISVVKLVGSRFNPASVLDVGCGRGIWIAEWRNAGIRDCVGIDGDYIDRHGLAVPDELFVATDISKSFDLGRSFDLVQSLEVAEHIPASQAEIFVDNLCRHGQIILFSAAVPGQGGEWHINEQPLDYWRSKFDARGYVAHDWLRPRIAKNSTIEPWYRFNSLVYASERVAAALPQEIQSTRLAVNDAIPVAAPITWRLRNAMLGSMPGGVINQLARLKHRARSAWIERTGSR